MAILASNADKRRLAAIDVAFSKENTTGFDRCSKESDRHKDLL